jgi:SAM-dependent methyltransferase
MPFPSAIVTLDRYAFTPGQVRELQPSLPAPVVYDVGAGLAPMRAPMEALGLAWHGFDLVPSAPGIRAWDLDHPCPAPGAAAGLALMLDVLEHLRNPGLGLRHVADVLLPGGCLLLTTPNPRWSRSRLEAVRTGFPSCFTPADLELNGHVFPAWPHIVERLLGEAGLRVETYVALDGRTAWPDHPFSFRFPFRAAHAAMNKWIERRDPTACGMSYALIARKAAGSPAREHL